MEIKKNINKGIISWSNAKYSQLISQELTTVNIQKSYIWTVDRDMDTKSNLRSNEHYLNSSGFKSRTGLNFFQTLFSPLLKSCSLLWRSLSYSCFYLQFKFMTFIYSQSFIHHFTGLFGTNIMSSSQLAC